MKPNLAEFLEIDQPVAQALSEGKPVVALESTIISHGMPYPQNVEVARQVEQVIIDQGAVPATIAVLGGKLKVGLNDQDLEYLGKAGHNVAKVSRKDLGVVLAQKIDGATTVSATMIIANLAGIEIFATGGVGGVHRGAETSFDISADLEELSRTPVLVVCAGAKAILDLPLTMEYLETKGVPVYGYQTDELPAFYTSKSGIKLDFNLADPEAVAKAYQTSRKIGLTNGAILTVPVPEKYSMAPEVINPAIEKALEELRAQNIQGSEVTPFLLAKVKELTGGDSLEANIALVLNNAKVAAQVAKQLVA
jgi:pseudouridine-5'-phosphate glycosidase